MVRSSLDIHGPMFHGLAFSIAQLVECSSVGRVLDLYSVVCKCESQTGQPLDKMLKLYSVIFRQIAPVER